MIDFFTISTRSTKRGVIEIYPKFIIKKSSDLMIRGGDFYAIWMEDRGLWSTNEYDALWLIDRELDRYVEENRARFECGVKVLYMWDSESRMIDSWHHYCQKQMRDSFHMLDEKLIFSNTPTNKKDYASKRLPYPLEQGDTDAWDKLLSTLYDEGERAKIEWAIGSIVSGESKKLQKFMVLYGAAGTGKSTVLNVIQQLFDGYYSVFDAKALGSTSNAFALEAFRTNPLVAIQHDGDLSKIEDNTRLNSLVSHELMTVNEKFKSTYANRFKCFLFMGTNKPVKITDGKSGLIRRLIDVSPSGNKLPPGEYKTIMKQIEFELGAIAHRCRDLYLANPGAYDDYIPVAMLGASNDFYNFVVDAYHVFKREDGVSLKAAWEMYKTYVDEAKVPFPFSQRIFKEELKNYFREYRERFNMEDGTRVRSYYTGFRTEKFEEPTESMAEKTEPVYEPICFAAQPSIFDILYAEYPAQYASENETPTTNWDTVVTKLGSLDTSRLHYVLLSEDEHHIVIDFDIPDETGAKCFARNLEEASNWPPTYAELSKSGQGIHLHYLYDGDVSKLSRIYDEHIEVKVFTGKSSLRRKLTMCNDLPIAHICSGLPLKGEKQMTNFEGVKNERALRTMIKRNLNKEYHAATKPSIDFINKILEDAYASGISYDVSDLRNAILAFAAKSTHRSDYCIKLVGKMHFRSEELSNPTPEDGEERLVFYDVEVFPNLFIVNWKMETTMDELENCLTQGERKNAVLKQEAKALYEKALTSFRGGGKGVVSMINPTPAEIEALLHFRLVGFNCRRYDNHILYARLMGYTNEQLFQLSSRIVKGDPNCFFGEAYNLSYTDVYDFSSKKQSLKKFEIDLGIHHMELGLPWDAPVAEELWSKVAEYCTNDVIATEAVFHARKADFTARKILADLAGMTVNDTTNSLTTKFIFGGDRKPQEQFRYRNMGDTSAIAYGKADLDLPGEYDEYTVFDKDRMPIFPGYVYDAGKSVYRGEEVGEGGYVYAEPGMYSNVALLDIASMHPSSIVAEELFGPKYTKRFHDILNARIAIKHKDLDTAKTMLGGALAKYLTDTSAAADLAQALKIVINSVYGLTSAGFENPFRDPRNRDNIVAKRGALFMINLKHEVQKRGFTVAHIKTDSIKIPDATPQIIEFVTEYGKLYGYNFEHEATYDRMCLVNDAVYIAKYKDGSHAGEWTATGKQFQVPYVFKRLFSKEEIVFDDLCETKSVNSALYLDMNEGLPDVRALEEERERLLKKDPPMEKEGLSEEIARGHCYHYIGKVGRFCPVKPGCGGGILLRETENKTNGEKGYAAVTGTKGYRWLESEMVQKLGREGDIDKLYYNALVDDAVDALTKYGDFERFIADEPFISDNTPPWFSAEEPYESETTLFDLR